MKLIERDWTLPTAEEVEAAKKELGQLGFLSKTMISLNQDYKTKLATILIGEHDKDKLLPLAQKIQDKFVEYYDITIEVNTSGNHVSPETEAKKVIANELIQLNKSLNNALDVEIYAPFTSKFNAVSAFYPSPSFLHSNLSSHIEAVYEAPIQHSSSFKLDDIVPNYNIAVTPPSSTGLYSYLAETFPSAEFLTHCLKSSSISTWSKYNIGRSRPMPSAWGLFLLALGLHPIYKLKIRENADEFAENALFQDLFPNWQTTFNAQQWRSLKRYDLQPYETNIQITHKEVNVEEYRAELLDHLKQWYKDGKKFRQFKTAQAVYAHLEELSDPKTFNDDKQKEIIEILLEMVKLAIFRQTFTRWVIGAFTPQYTFSADLDDKIYDQSSVASLLHLECNPNPNIYVMLRSLFDDESGFAETITHASGVSRETWSRYEQGTRIPHNVAWTSIVLAIDMHPIYRLVKRKDSPNTKEVYEIYQELHQTLDTPRAVYRIKGDPSSIYYSEFHTEPGTPYQVFHDTYLS